MSPSTTTSTVVAPTQNGDLRNRKNISQYTTFWKGDHQDDSKQDEERRKGEYQDLVNGYYDGVTDLYEYGWGQNFHFARYFKGEAFAQGIARHEHYLAAQIGIKANMRVLDVGCGVGGPAREICWFTDANIVGINNNVFQVDRATKYALKAGLGHKLTFEKGNFMDMASQFGENSFDAVYAIEATVHAPECEGVYGEVYKVLKPGAIFGFYEWCLTEKYDKDNPVHRQIRHEIELGDAIPELRSIERSIQGLKSVGFEILRSENLAERDDPLPWYYPIRGKFSEAQTLWDYFTIFRLTTLGKGMVSTAVRVMETFGMVPKGTAAVDKSLNIAAKALVAGGETGIFTPMQLFVCRKPL